MALTNRENSREFLTRGKFRLFFSFPPSFLKNRWKLRFQLVFPLARSSYRRHRASELRSGHCQTPSQLLFSPPPRTHAHLHRKNLGRHVFTRNLPNPAPAVQLWRSQLYATGKKAEGSEDGTKVRRHALAIGGIMTIVPILPVLFARSLIGHIGVGVGFKRKGARSDVEN